MFGLEYNPKFFYFTMTSPHCYVLEKEIREKFGWKVEDTKEIWFSHSPTKKIYKIPYEKRFERQKFLLS
ncbi:MAG: hypothetical protein LBC61_05000 [Candidatus Peribacteria bacterium]|nr:hypothetical protein [Candidatus Peribacteria bacterium]